jgi:hypothetical protein
LWDVLTQNDAEARLVIALSHLNVNQPAAELFDIPPEYKVVDVTPPEQERQQQSSVPGIR